MPATLHHPTWASPAPSLAPWFPTFLTFPTFPATTVQSAYTGPGALLKRPIPHDSSTPQHTLYGYMPVSLTPRPCPLPGERQSSFTLADCKPRCLESPRALSPLQGTSSGKPLVALPPPLLGPHLFLCNCGGGGCWTSSHHPGCSSSQCIIWPIAECLFPPLGPEQDLLSCLLRIPSPPNSD